MIFIISRNSISNRLSFSNDDINERKLRADRDYYHALMMLPEKFNYEMILEVKDNGMYMYHTTEFSTIDELATFIERCGSPVKISKSDNRYLLEICDVA